MTLEKFNVGDYVYGLYSNDEFEIITSSDCKFINNNPNHFTKDKEYCDKVRESLKYEEYEEETNEH